MLSEPLEFDPETYTYKARDGTVIWAPQELVDRINAGDPKAEAFVQRYVEQERRFLGVTHGDN